MEFVRARLTVQTTNKYNGMWDCMVKVSRHEGPLTLFKGLWPSLIVRLPSDCALSSVLR